MAHQVAAQEIINLWTKAQIQLVENFMEAARQMQGIATEEHKEKGIERLVAIYQDWQKKQMEIVEGFVADMKQHANLDISPLHEYLQNFNKAQENLGKNWSESLQEASEKYFGSHLLSGYQKGIDSANDYFNKFVMQWFEPITKPFKEFSSSGFGAYNVMMETVKDYMKAFYPEAAQEKTKKK
jgi:hypothetical protein